MKHLLNYSVYQGMSFFGEDVRGKLSSIGCDGLELLTSHGVPDPVYRDYTVSVHLPYAADWMAAWEGHPHDMDASYVPFYMFGTDRESVASTVARSIAGASSLEPAYGVMHACNVGLGELYKRTFSRTSEQVLETFAEMMNSAVALLPHGRPPFRIMFENLWWPGLLLTDDSGYRILERRIEFDDWGICLDTGHLMSSLPCVYSERDGIEAVLDVVHKYPQDLLDRIGAVHFHYSATGRYRESFEEKEAEGDIMDFITQVYGHISRIDMHLPFSDPLCGQILDVLAPDYVTHEMSGSVNGLLEDFRQQRLLLD